MTTDSRIGMPPPTSLERSPGRAWSTLAVWLVVASLPLGFATYLILGLVSTIPGGPGQSILLLFGVWPVLMVVFTVQDRKALLALGYRRPPRRPWLLPFTPLYLLVRFLRTRAEGASWASSAPLWVYLANLAFAIATVLLAVSLAPQPQESVAAPGVATLQQLSLIHI